MVDNSLRLNTSDIEHIILQNELVDNSSGLNTTLDLVDGDCVRESDEVNKTKQKTCLLPLLLILSHS